MPEMMVWPVSVSLWTLNDGSSAAILARDCPSLSWSALVAGSMAISMTGCGICRVSSTTGSRSSDRVSPVVVFLSPTRATMSPA